MMRFALLFSALAIATLAPAAAQTPGPHGTPTSPALSRKVPASNFVNPGNHASKLGPMSGQGCMSGPGANRSQAAINPINGHAQAATIISIPIGKGGGSVANATTRSQQAQACAHTH
jgi:hypothetical protein